MRAAAAGKLAAGSEPMPDASQLATYARLLKLTPVQDAALPPLVIAPAAESVAPARRRWPADIVSLLLLVVLPTCLAAGYFWLLAADRYQTEARFVLRMPGRAITNAAVANLLQNSGVTRSTDDGYVVKEFLESRDAMAWLEKNSALRAVYGEPKWDLIWRFPNPFSSDTEEGLYSHYQRMMTASFDSTTGVSTLRIQAFTPADAQRLAVALLDAAEALVNRLNERARRDAIGLAEAAAEQMRQRALAAQAALTAFRERERLVDPSQATLAVLETIAKLSQEAAQVSVQLGELGKASPDGPQLTPLRTRRAALEAQIAIERHRLAGDAQSIAPRIAEYESLMLEREFAEKALMAAMTAVEVARVEALRQQVYLERVAAPGQPDYPTYPWRIVWCLVIASIGYMASRMWRILSADALRHAEP
jgi:capsular polysaccharide transport system permease protein